MDFQVTEVGSQNFRAVWGKFVCRVYNKNYKTCRNV